MSDPVADPDGLNRELEALRARIAGLPAPDAAALADEAVASLQTSVDALRVAEEELRVQNAELAEAQSALEHERTRLANLFDEAPDAYVVTDANGRIADANRRAVELLALPHASLLRKPLPLYVVLDDRVRLRRALRTLLADEAEPLVLRLQRRDRVRLWVEFRGAVADVDGKPEIRWVLRDVTDRIQAEEQLWELNADLERRVAERTVELDAQRAQLEAVLNAMPGGVLLVAPDLSTRALNPAGDRVLAHSDGATFRRLDGSEYGEADLPGGRALATGEPVVGERVVITSPQGKVVVYAVDAVPVPGDEPRSAVVVCSDMTERDRRERADRDFVSNAAHQLRTPLAAIASVVAALQGGAKDVPEERERFLGHLQRETDRLARLGRAMLTLARAQRGDEEAQRSVVPLRPVLDAIVAEVPPKDGVDVEVDCAGDVGAIANDELLAEALSNLVGNAVSYTDRGTVSIRARMVDRTTTVEIADTGRGIARDDQSRVFERFYRSSEGARGFGLGLSIASSAVEAAGGAIALDSEEGVGTTVRLELPSARVVA